MATNITLAPAVAVDDQRNHYEVELLRLVLGKSGAQYKLKFAPIIMLQSRVILEIAKGRGNVDIMAGMTSKERETELLAVRIPIDKGLIGWRIPLVSASRKEMFERVHGLTDLSQLLSGQGHDWPDVGILRGNGLPVYAARSYEALFSMLEAGRIDYFPRSVAEIWQEAARFTALAVDRHIVIHYPSAQYYFVNRNNTQLADAIRRGLEAAIADGSFEKLFNQYFAESIRLARLDHRRLIELRNPSLPDGLPLAHRKLWFTLENARRAGDRAKPNIR